MHCHEMKVLLIKVIDSRNNNMSFFLVLTSMSFLTLVIHSYYMHHTKYHHLFLGVTVLSVAFHSSENPCFLLRACDMALAHFAFAIVLFDMLSCNLHWSLWLFPIIISFIWFLEHQTFLHKYRLPLHIGLHVMSILCVHLLLSSSLPPPIPLL